MPSLHSASRPFGLQSCRCTYRIRSEDIGVRKAAGLADWSPPPQRCRRLHRLPFLDAGPCAKRSGMFKNSYQVGPAGTEHAKLCICLPCAVGHCTGPQLTMPLLPAPRLPLLQSGFLSLLYSIGSKPLSIWGSEGALSCRPAYTRGPGALPWPGPARAPATRAPPTPPPLCPRACHPNGPAPPGPPRRACSGERAHQARDG